MTDTSPEAPHAVTMPTVEYDEKGRPEPVYMTDRELLLELVAHLRTLADTVTELSDSPMVRALQGGGNPLLAMMRG